MEKKQEVKKEVIGVIGHFGGKEKFFDGQTVKTKTLTAALNACGEFSLMCVDTYYNKKSKVKLLWDTLRCIFKCKKIIVLLSGNGMHIYFPLLYIAHKVLKRKIFHDVIGGNLDSYIRKYPKWKKYLASFEVNWVELELMKESLQSLGIDNVEVVPNFKSLQILERLEMDKGTEVLRLCTFSRVAKEKGITDGIEAVERVNKRSGKLGVTLDVWGQIEEKYSAEFNELINKYPEYVKYCGIAEFDSSVSVLEQYDVLLFPTYWEGEGFPGTIVDAFASGLPVIATDWKGNKEIIKTWETGIVYPGDGIGDLVEAIEWTLHHKEDMKKMRVNCLREAYKYTTDACIGLIAKRLSEA